MHTVVVVVLVERTHSFHQRDRERQIEQRARIVERLLDVREPRVARPEEGRRIGGVGESLQVRTPLVDSLAVDRLRAPVDVHALVHEEIAERATARVGGLRAHAPVLREILASLVVAATRALDVVFVEAEREARPRLREFHQHVLVVRGHTPHRFHRHDVPRRGLLGELEVFDGVELRRRGVKHVGRRIGGELAEITSRETGYQREHQERAKLHG